MPNPSEAFKNTICDECASEINEGDDVFFYEGEKYCRGCADDIDIVCDCGCFKQPEYDTCYGCHNS